MVNSGEGQEKEVEPAGNLADGHSNTSTLSDVLAFQGARLLAIFEESEDLILPGRKSKTPTLPNQRVGHPKKPNWSLSVDVRWWYYPIASLR